MIISEELQAELKDMIKKPTRRWNEEREAILTFLYSRTTNQEIARIMEDKFPEHNWNKRVIANKAYHLGLRR